MKSIKGNLIGFIFLLVLGITFSLSILYYNNLKGNLMEEKRTHVKHLVESAISVLDYYNVLVDDNELSKETAMDMAKNQLQNIRFGDDNTYYFWIKNSVPEVLMHPHMPELLEIDASTFQDKKGNYVIVDMVDIVEKDGSGFIDYYWQYLDDEDRIEAKLSYVKLYKPWDWIIGTGIYTLDVQESIEKIQNQIILTSIIILLIAIIIIYYISNHITDPIRSAIGLGDKIAKGDLTVQLPKKYLRREDETGVLARTLNEMANNLWNQREELHASYEQLTAYSQELTAINDELDKSMNEVSDLNKRLSTIFDNVEQGICLHEMVYKGDKPVDYIIIDANPAFEKTLGISISKARNSLASKLYGTGSPPFIDIYYNVAKTGKPSNFEEYFAPMNKYFHITVTSPEKDKFITLFSDITESKLSQEKIKKALKEKETLLKEIHHRVKNNLQVISSLLSLQGRKIKDESILSIFNDAKNRVKAMSLVHQKLYSSESLESIDLEGYIKDLVNNLVYSNASGGKTINVKYEIEKLYVKIDEAIPIGLILNELVTNSLKHAFNNKNEGKLLIRVYTDQDNIILMHKDNGEGMPEGFDIDEPDTLGWQLVKVLSGELNGSIEIYSKNGIEILLKYPKMTTK